MRLLPYSAFDITPRSIGSMSLFLTSYPGNIELQEYICGTSFFHPIMRGNYSNLSLFLSTSTCYQVRNLENFDTTVQFLWTYSSTLNTFILLSLFLYLLLLGMFGCIILVCCSFGAKKVRNYIFDKITVQFEKKCEAPFNPAFTNTPPLYPIEQKES